MEVYHQYCHPGTQCGEQMYQTDESVHLRVIHFRPAEPSPYPPIVMIVGLATVIESFQGIINGLTRDFELYYVETREKSSSQISGKVKFDMETVAFDIVSIIQQLELVHRQNILFGYSFSAAAIVEAYRHLDSKPVCLNLLSPTPSFYYPNWSLPLIRMAVPIYGVLKPITKWYLRNFIMNVKADRDMYNYTSRALDLADPQKLRDTILAIAGYAVWDKLPHIDCSTLIVDTSLDGLHRHEDVVRLAESIEGSSYIDLETNKRTHGTELAVVMRDFISTLR